MFFVYFILAIFCGILAALIVFSIDKVENKWYEKIVSIIGFVAGIACFFLLIIAATYLDISIKEAINITICLFVIAFLIKLINEKIESKVLTAIWVSLFALGALLGTLATGGL